MTEELSEKIVDTALSLLAESGVDGMRGENVVQRLKVAPGEFARLFPDDRALWSALLSRVHRRLMSLVEHAAARGTDSLDALEQVFHSHVSFISANPAIPRLLFHLSQSDDPPLRAQVVRIAADYESGLVVLMNQAKAEGRIGPDVDIRAAAMLFITTIHGLVFRALMTGETGTLVNGAQRVLVIYMDGMRFGALSRSRNADTAAKLVR